MKLISNISNAIQSIVDVCTKALTKTVPELGETTFLGAHMVNNTVGTAALAQAIENQKEINLLLGRDEQVTEEQLNAIMKKLEY